MPMCPAERHPLPPRPADPPHAPPQGYQRHAGTRSADLLRHTSPSAGAGSSRSKDDAASRKNEERRRGPHRRLL